MRKLSDDTAISKLASIVEPIFHSPAMNRHLSQTSWPPGMHSNMNPSNMFSGIINRINSSPPLRQWMNPNNQNHQVPSSVAFSTPLPPTRLINSESPLGSTNNQMLVVGF